MSTTLLSDNGTGVMNGGGKSALTGERDEDMKLLVINFCGG